MTLNPRDAVAVPTDDAQRLRMCRYRVAEFAPANPYRTAMVAFDRYDEPEDGDLNEDLADDGDDDRDDDGNLR